MCETFPTPPEPHFPSPYGRPTQPPARALRVERPDGAQIATFLYGSLDSGLSPVLMIHGNGEEHGIFGPTIDAVTAEGRPVVAVDSRAQGRSTRGTSRLTYELMAEDALAAADALGVGPFHVLGFSDGGIEALLLARDHADRVLSLTALGANLSPEGVIDDGWDLAGVAASNEAWADWVEKSDLPADLMTPTPDEARATAELLRLMVEEPHIDPTSLAAISCPTTVMVGEFDCIDEWETYRIVDAIPGAELYVSWGNGHTLPKHAPDEVTYVLMDTIGRAEG